MRTNRTIQKILPLLAAIILAFQFADAQCVAPPSGIVAWWKAEGDANDLIGTNNGVLVNGVSFTSGEVGQAFSFNGNQYVDIADSPSLEITNTITVEAWINRFSTGSQHSIVEKYFCPAGGGYAFRVNSNDKLEFYTEDDCHNASNATGSTTLQANQWYHVVGLWDGSNIQVYVNGIIDGTFSSTRNPKFGTTPLRIGARGDDTATRFYGLIDEVAIYNRALSANEIQAIYAAGNAGMCRIPIITSEPQSQVGYLNQSVQFEVTAIPSSPILTFQWQTNGVPLPGATNQTLVLTNLQISNAGAYSVVVVNSYGSVTSAPPATLTVNNASLALYPGLTLYGNMGTVYGIQASTNLSTGWWFGLANVTLTNTAELWYDSIPAWLSQRFYRAVPGPISIP